MKSPHSKSKREILEYFCVDLESGLNSKQVAKQSIKNGKNSLPKFKQASYLSLVAEQFNDLLVLILLGAACISFVLSFLDSSESLRSAFVEPAVILLILVANATVGVVQETKAQMALDRLKDFESKKATVVRNGQILVIGAESLVPGDVIHLSPGQRIPADCRLMEVTTMSMMMCDESMLTGETEAKEKRCVILDEKSCKVVQDMNNMLFMGTLTVKGKCIAVVVRTAKNTELGKIYSELERLEAEKTCTPLQEKLNDFATHLTWIIFTICLFVWFINIGHFTDPKHGSFIRGAVYYLKIAVSLAVAAIPEGLPAVVTTCLALGTKRMAQKNAIVRTLSSVETLGCTSVICSDKTGTITLHRMVVRSVLTFDSSGVLLQKQTVCPKRKKLIDDQGKEISKPCSKNSALRKICQISHLCNDATILKDNGETKNKSNTSSQKITGDPTEVALIKLIEVLDCEVTGKRIIVFDFDRSRKMMSTIDSLKVEGKETTVCHTKGAPELILGRCNRYLDENGKIKTLTNDNLDQIHDQIDSMASSGQRALAFAFRILESSEELKNLEAIRASSKEEGSRNVNKGPHDDGFYCFERQMVFCGFVGMLDPPREEVAEAVRRCREAGIRVVVVTGDHRKTAESICRQIGLMAESSDRASPHEPLMQNRSMTAKEFMRLGPEEKAKAVEKTTVFSRVEPHHKLELVQLLKKNGHVVAMTGDGVNDASALRCADIGIAMGSGTQVAQQASDMVLQTDDFTTIVDAVEEGRSIFGNMKQFIRYLISSNIGEVACVFFTAILGIPEVLIPVQLLWVNLVTDGLPATALGFNSVDAGEMRRPPRDRAEKIIDTWLLFRYMIVGIYIGVATIVGYVWWFTSYSHGPQISFSQLSNHHSCGKNADLFPPAFDCSLFYHPAPATVALSILVAIEMFNTFNALSENASLISVPPWSNPYVVAAVTLSFLLHATILYIKPLQGIFKTAPLGVREWAVIFALSAPIVLIDEALKLLTRLKNRLSSPGKIA